MFTGLVEEVGTVLSVVGTEAGSRIRIQAKEVLQGARLGDSIAIDGVCTTAVELTEESFLIEASPETLSRTTFRFLEPDSRVNLERPLTPTARLGGHFVTGHVDCTATITERRQAGNSWIYRFRLDTPEYARYLIEKGSVAVSGISLTVNEVDGATFAVAIIPYTMQHTSLARLGVTDRVNIETDMLGKYVDRLLNFRQPEEAATPGAGERQQTTLTTAFLDSVYTNLPATKVRAGEWFNTDDLIHSPEQGG